MAFDVEAARKAGYTDAEIAPFLASSAGFDLAGAKAAGYSDGEIIARLSAKVQAPAAIPGQEGEAARKLAAQQAEAMKPQPTLADRAIGAGEAALSVGTGMTGGTIGMIGGTLKGLAEQILSGQFGTQQAADMVDKAAAEGAQSMTFAPRTQQGQQQAAVVGEAMQNLAPVAAVLPGMAPAGAGAAAMQGLRTGAAGVLDRAASAMPAAMREKIGAGPVAAPEAVVAPVVAPAAMTPEAIASTARKAANGGIGASKAEQVLAEQAAPDPTKVAAAQRLGIQDYLQPDHVTTNEAYRQVSAVLKSSNPGSGLSLAEREGLGKVAQRAADLVDEIGGTHDLSSLDASVKTNLQTTAAALESKADALYSKLRATIPAKTEAPADNVLAFVSKRAEELGGVQNLSPMERRIVARLSPKEVSTTETVPGNPLMPGSMTATKQRAVVLKQPTYTLLDDVRRDIGAAARQRGPFKDADTGLAKKLYELITLDQDKVAGEAGMGDVLTAAKAAVSQRKGIENDLASLFGRNLDQSMLRGGSDSLGSAIRSVGQGDVSGLTKLLSAVPEGMRQQVVASGLGSVFKKASAAGQMDFTGYAKWYEGLRTNRQAYSAVMSNLSLSARKQLAALYDVSRGVSDSLNRRITTGRVATVKEELLGKEALLDRLYALASRSAVGAAAGTVVSPVLGPGVGAALASALTKTKSRSMAAVDDLIGSREFAHLVQTTANSKEQAQAARAVARSQAFNRFVRALGADGSAVTANREAWLISAMRAPAPQTNQQNATH
jgi:hypothetical protein